MTPRRRTLFALSGIALSLAVGCGGGDKKTPVIGGGSPTPVPAQSAPFVTVDARPLTNGDQFAYSGTTQKAFVYAGASPSPASNTTYAVTQAVNVSGPTTYAGQSAYDVKTVETDTSSLQSIASTTDSFDALVGGNLVTYGYTSSDTFGEQLAVTIPGAGNIIDQLPEQNGATFSNGAAETIAETSPGNQTSQRTYNADGSYTDTTNYPAGSLYPANVGTITGTITENGDGSGRYVLAANGTPVQELDVGTPRPVSSGAPFIPISQPQPTGTPLETDIRSWYPTPVTLYSETDKNQGGSTFPGNCKVPATIATTANALVQTIGRVDTVFGTLETMTTTSYVVPNDGVACQTISDQIQYFYDYSGQSPFGPNGAPSVGSTPIEIETVATTIGLASAKTTAERRALGEAGSGYRLANGRANFLALVEREKRRHRDAFARRLLGTLMGRTTR